MAVARHSRGSQPYRGFGCHCQSCLAIIIFISDQPVSFTILRYHGPFFSRSVAALSCHTSDAGNAEWPNQAMQPTALRRYVSISNLASVIQPAAICAFQSGG